MSAEPAEGSSPSRVRASPRAGARVMAVLLAFVALTDLWQVLSVLMGLDDEPPVLVLQHTAAGLLGAAAAVGAARERPWAPAATMAWGVATAALLVTLTPVLGLPREGMLGLWFAAACVLVLAGGAAAYLRPHPPA